MKESFELSNKKIDKRVKWMKWVMVERKDGPGEGHHTNEFDEGRENRLYMYIKQVLYICRRREREMINKQQKQQKFENKSGRFD